MIRFTFFYCHFVLVSVDIHYTSMPLYLGYNVHGSFFTWSVHQPMHTLELFILKLLKMLRHVSIIWSSSGSCLFLAKITLLKTFTAWFSYNNLVIWQHVVLCRSSVVRSAPDCVCRFTTHTVRCTSDRQLPDDDQMIETCWSIFKSFNVNNLSVCIGWCADQVTLRSARCNDKVRLCSLIKPKFSGLHNLLLRFWRRKYFVTKHKQEWKIYSKLNYSYCSNTFFPFS